MTNGVRLRWFQAPPAAPRQAYRAGEADSRRRTTESQKTIVSSSGWRVRDERLNSSNEWPPFGENVTCSILHIAHGHNAGVRSDAPGKPSGETESLVACAASVAKWSMGQHRSSQTVDNTVDTTSSAEILPTGSCARNESLYVSEPGCRSHSREPCIAPAKGISLGRRK